MISHFFIIFLFNISLISCKFLLTMLPENILVEDTPVNEFTIGDSDEEPKNYIFGNIKESIN